MRRAALRDPAYHRYLMFGAVDLMRKRSLGRDLKPWEKQSELWKPQEIVIKRAERAMAERSGEVIVVRQARQTGKNEEEAMLECRMLSIWRALQGSIYVRIAPTMQPQIVNSKLRLDKHLAVDPVLRGGYTKHEGFIYACKGAAIHFLTAQRTANVVGGTASVCLSADEAHKIDKGKFDEDFAPFTASTNAPTVLWGVAAAKQDLLYEYREKADGTDRVLEFPAAVWCELSEAYAAHYEQRVKHLGATHPIIRTQYDLVDMESLGTYLNDAQRAALFSGDHPRLQAPRAGYQYAAVIDVGGEAEEDADDNAVREEQPTRDSSFVHVLEWKDTDLPPAEVYPMVRVVASFWWTGRAHMTCEPDVCDLIRHWRIRSGVVDARGVGEALAMSVHKKFPFIQAYKASAPDVSDDCYDLLARLNLGRVRYYRSDPATDEVQAEMQQQAQHTKYKVSGHVQMKLQKPTSTAHIDGIKALTYLHRAIRPHQPIVEFG